MCSSVMNLRAEWLTASRDLKLDAGEKAPPIGYLLGTYRLRLMFFSICVWLSVRLSWRFLWLAWLLPSHFPVMDFLFITLFHFLLDLIFLLPLFCHPIQIKSNVIERERDRVNRQSQNSRPYTWSEVLIRKYMYRRRHIRTNNKHK